MFIYKFLDTDPYEGNEDYDIAGVWYEKFMQLCFKHSASVSFQLSPDFKEKMSALEPYRLPLTENVKAINNVRESDISATTGYRVIHYRLAPEVRRFLLTRASSIFQWQTGLGFENPEDPCFFRSDDSVFFSSVIHEGECILHPDPGEDISEIFQCGIWYQTIGYWEVWKKRRYFNNGNWAMYGGPGLRFIPGYPGYIQLARYLLPHGTGDHGTGDGTGDGLREPF